MSVRTLNFIFSLCIIFTLIFSPVAFAQDAIAIEEGEQAPFSGTLLSNEGAASLLTEIRTCSERSEADLEFELERERATCELDTSLLQIRIDSITQRYESIVQSQDEQLDYIIKSSGSTGLSKEATFVLGIFSGVLITTGAAWGLSSIANSN
tara:strand:+ start:920 stop:1375 length:456 start_codon:yes stop_codon:yes gene_type:complete